MVRHCQTTEDRGQRTEDRGQRDSPSVLCPLSSVALRIAAAGVVAALVLLSAAPGAVRIKDITSLQGARSNQLIGFGLVVGLDGTGSRSIFTRQVAVDMLQRFKLGGTTVGINRTDPVFLSGTISAVMVTAELGPFSRRGSKIDAMVSTIDDATALQGGTLLLCPLKGADGIDYAVAQGPLSVGGFSFQVPSGSQQPLASSQKNHPTVGRIPGGAIVEREAIGEILCDDQIRLLLRDPDYETARGIARAVSARYPGSAYAVDAGTVQVFVPHDRLTDVVAFAADVGGLEVNPDTTAKVVINERTGTVVAGEQVRISTVAVAHGNLSIQAYDQPLVTQPLPFTAGGTVITPQANIQVREQSGTLRVVQRGVTVADVARALNALGVTPRDLIAIFQAIKQAGALHADLVIM